MNHYESLTTAVLSINLQERELLCHHIPNYKPKIPGVDNQKYFTSNRTSNIYQKSITNVFVDMKTDLQYAAFYAINFAWSSMQHSTILHLIAEWRCPVSDPCKLVIVALGKVYISVVNLSCLHVCLLSNATLSNIPALQRQSIKISSGPENLVINNMCINSCFWDMITTKPAQLTIRSH